MQKRVIKRDLSKEYLINEDGNIEIIKIFINAQTSALAVATTAGLFRRIKTVTLWIQFIENSWNNL